MQTVTVGTSTGAGLQPLSLPQQPSVAHMISTRMSIKQTTSERLSKLVAEFGLDDLDRPIHVTSNSECPMVSLPDNDNYWCEGWGCASGGVSGGGAGYDETLTTSDHTAGVTGVGVGGSGDDLVVSSTSSLSTPLSASGSISTSSSPSPSPSTQSGGGAQKQHQHHQHNTSPHSVVQGTNTTFSCFDFEPHSVAEHTYRESFVGKVSSSYLYKSVYYHEIYSYYRYIYPYSFN